MDLNGHYHRSDLRFHEANQIYDPELECFVKDESIADDDYFLERVIFPPLSPTSYTAPAFSTIQYSNGTLSNLEMTFL